MTELVTCALRRARPDIDCVAADGPAEALRQAITMAAGNAVLFVYEKLEAATGALAAAGAEPVPAAEIDPAGIAAAASVPSAP